MVSKELVINRELELPSILFSVDLIFLIRVSPSDKISRKQEHFNASLIIFNIHWKGKNLPCSVLFSCCSLLSPRHRCPLTGQVSGGRVLSWLSSWQGKWCPGVKTKSESDMTWGKGRGKQGVTPGHFDPVTSSPASLSKHSNNSNSSLNAHYQWIVLNRLRI